jgi:hypothetical protein
MDCIKCGKIFFGNNIKFCSMKCYKDYMDDSKKSAEEEPKKDPHHTRNMSDSQ